MVTAMNRQPKFRFLRAHLREVLATGAWLGVALSSVHGLVASQGASDSQEWHQRCSVLMVERMNVLEQTLSVA